MERLTKNIGDGIIVWAHKGTRQDVLERLAAYENTGLEPAEVEKVCLMLGDSRRYAAKIEAKLRALSGSKEEKAVDEPGHDPECPYCGEPMCLITLTDHFPPDITRQYKCLHCGAAAPVAVSDGDAYEKATRRAEL